MIRNALKHRENVHICKCVLLILCACASQNDQSQKKRRWAIHIPFEIEAKMWPKNTCIKNGQKLREYKMAKKSIGKDTYFRSISDTDSDT